MDQVLQEWSVDKLKEFLEGYRVPELTTPKINEYIVMRMQEEVVNTTINRGVSALKRLLNLGMKQSPPLVDRVPYIPMLKENNTRKSFFEHDEYLALKKVLPVYLKDFVTFAYKTG